MKNAWWKERVFYQIYPRSFMDSNNDGIGDIRGIISKLDYLKWLGIGAVWLCPVYASPNADMGYDISDYEKIMDEFGSMEDFDELLSELHKRDIKLIMDLVVNHSSDEHRWFIESRKSKDNPYRDYYIWREGKDGKEPNNWSSFFTPSAWSYDKESNQWYLHLFSEKQPDLNWESSAVRDEVFGMINRWFDKGVDGFRMDVISLIAKNRDLPDGNGAGYVFSPEYFAFQPKLHDYLREMRSRCFDGRDCMCVGETTFVNTENANSVVGDGRELDLLFQFDLMDIDADGSKWNVTDFSLPRFMDVIDKWQKAIEWNTLFWSNHDQPRAVSRFGSTETEQLWKRSAKMLATAMYLLKGTPFIYQGEEIGMTNVPFSDASKLRDIESINFLAEEDSKGKHDYAWNGILKKGRDNARTPMQWNRSKNAGFSQTTPWIDVNDNFTKINVESELNDEDSILHFYRKLINFHNGSDIIKYGEYKQIFFENERIFGYERTFNGKTLYIICNFSKEEASLELSENIDFIINLGYSDSKLLPFSAVVF